MAYATAQNLLNKLNGDLSDTMKSMIISSISHYIYCMYSKIT